MLFNLIEDRKVKVEKEEGTVSDKDDSKEETKGAEHILEVRRREEGFHPRMQTRLSQQQIVETQGKYLMYINAVDKSPFFAERLSGNYNDMHFESLVQTK